MLLNADFSQPAVVTPDRYHWVQSPQSGVDRMMLDRAGGELARATSIVRYAPGSRFPHHRHPGGEEIFVLVGTFSDGEADYPAGWYLRNPPGSAHAPFSRDGALILVKLCQMPLSENRPVRIDTRDPARWELRDGRDVCPLFARGAERVCLERLAPGSAITAGLAGGAEVLVLSGIVMRSGQTYVSGSWLRLPAPMPLDLVAGRGGATIYLKTGHLATGATEVPA